MSYQPISVRLLKKTDASVLDMATYAAKTCYQAEMPEFETLQEMDVDGRLNKTGHHTTLQHNHYSFAIERIPVSAVTLGLHLTHPFYNSDQRSGRFCAAMFAKPDFDAMMRQIRFFWPELDQIQNGAVEGFLRHGVHLYNRWLEPAIALARVWLKEDRPKASTAYIEANAPKIAQEQLRVFISTAFPTALVHTLNFNTLQALNAINWSPPVAFVYKEMKRLVIESEPELEKYFFPPVVCAREDYWQPRWAGKWWLGVHYSPEQKVLQTRLNAIAEWPRGEHCFPLDLLPFDPRFMSLSQCQLTSEITVSLATMGQDQRHRILHRSAPEFTRHMYCPPLLHLLGLREELFALGDEWMALAIQLPCAFGTSLAPYGAMVRYEKSGNLQAVIHEQMKRLCWCAQEEIYNASRQLRSAPELAALSRIFEPSCYRTGKCGEGPRYCGRDLSLRETGDYFPQRRI